MCRVSSVQPLKHNSSPMFCSSLRSILVYSRSYAISDGNLPTIFLVPFCPPRSLGGLLVHVFAFPFLFLSVSLRETVLCMDYSCPWYRRVPLLSVVLWPPGSILDYHARCSPGGNWVHLACGVLGLVAHLCAPWFSSSYLVAVPKGFARFHAS